AAVGKLTNRALDEHPTAVGEDQRSEQRRDEARSRGPTPRLVPERVLDHRGPDDGGDREHQGSPAIAPEHLDAMTGVLVVGRVRVVITVTISPASASGRFAGPR